MSAGPVYAHIEALDHPGRPVIHALRLLVLDASPQVREEIKWNAPSFFIADHFATMNLRGDRVWLILHAGAKAKGARISVPDPTGLLEWLGQDRAVVKLTDLPDLEAKRAPLQALLRAWIAAI